MRDPPPHTIAIPPEEDLGHPVLIGLDSTLAPTPARRMLPGQAPVPATSKAGPGLPTRLPTGSVRPDRSAAKDRLRALLVHDRAPRLGELKAAIDGAAAHLLQPGSRSHFEIATRDGRPVLVATIVL